MLGADARARSDVVLEADEDGDASDVDLEAVAAVLGADSLPQRKPSPEPVLKLLRDFAVEAGESVIVGDSINDITAGKDAGVLTVGCSYGYGDADEIAGADFFHGRRLDVPGRISSAKYHRRR